MIILNESEKNIVKEIVKDDRTALEIVENLDRDDTNNNGWFYKHHGTVALLVFLLVLMLILLGLMLFICHYQNRTLSLILLIGTIIVLLFPPESLASMFDNEREPKKVKEDRAYLNTILEKESTAIKYPIHSHTRGIIWYFKDNHLMNVKCDEVDGITYVIYREYYEIGKYSLLKKEKFDHLEKTA